MSTGVITPRAHWMDALRGMAVLLVILTHTATMPAGLEAEFAAPGLVRFTQVFHALRMPLLMFLSGTFLPRSLEKPLGVYARGKLERVLWPFIVWMTVLALCLGTPEHLLSWGYWRGGAWHLWFLWVLLFCYLVGPLARRVPPALIALGLFLLLLEMAGGPRDHLRMLYWGVYFFLGAAAARHLPRIRSVRPVLALGALALAVLAILDHLGGGLVVSERRPWSVLAALPGILFMLWLGPRLPRLPFLEFCGRRSIVLFVSHLPVLILAVTLLRGLAPEHPGAFYAAMAAATFLVPLALARAYPRVRWLYESPTAGLTGTQLRAAARGLVRPLRARASARATPPPAAPTPAPAAPAARPSPHPRPRRAI